MTTRLDLRTALRRRLEDSGAGPLWDDATLDDAIADAMRHYGARFPTEATTTVTVPAGAGATPVTPAIEHDRVVRIFDQDGEYVPRHTAFEPNARRVAQTWRWWNSTLFLAQPPTATGNWTIEHLAARALPTDDVTPLDLIPGDEEIVTLLALVTALRRRAVEDAKRGLDRSSASIAALADRAEKAAAWLISSRTRRARGAFLS